jgi:hypothetical protein
VTIQDVIAQQESGSTLDLVVNRDETAWRIVASGLVTSASLGENRVHVRLDGNKTNSVTVLDCVTAVGWKLEIQQDKKTFEHHLSWLTTGNAD